MATPPLLLNFMVYVTGNLEGAIKNFRHEISKSGLVTSLKLRKIAKKSLRRREKERVAARRKVMHQKRRVVYQKENDKG